MKGMRDIICQGSWVHPVAAGGHDRSVVGTVVSPVTKKGKCTVSWGDGSKPQVYNVSDLVVMSKADQQRYRNQLRKQIAKLLPVERPPKSRRAKVVRGGLPGHGKRR
jgi:hypothetical protein